MLKLFGEAQPIEAAVLATVFEFALRQHRKNTTMFKLY
jgi:hypothetical protein